MENNFLESVARSLNVELPYRESLDDYLDLILDEIQKWSEDVHERSFYSSKGGKPWLEVRDDDNFYSKVLHFFNEEGEYLRSSNGDVVRGNWRYMPDTNKILIEAGNTNELYDLAYLDANFFILKKSGKGKYFAMGREGYVDGLEWRDYVELLFNTYRSRHRAYRTAVIIILLIVAIIVLFSIF